MKKKIYLYRLTDCLGNAQTIVVNDPSDNGTIGGVGNDGQYHQYDSYEMYHSHDWARDHGMVMLAGHFEKDIPESMFDEDIDVPFGDITLTYRSWMLFVAILRDLGNWSGTPLWGGNIGRFKSDEGNLTHLKKLNLVFTDTSEGCTWVELTDEGRKLAADMGMADWLVD